MDLPLPAGRWAKRLDSAEARWLGAGSALPEVVEANGAGRVTVSPWSVAVYSELS